jgi:uncharacterized cupin superfamily protein
MKGGTTMATVKSIPVSNIVTSEYEPFVHEGEQMGEVHWLRVGSGGDGVLYTGLWTHEPGELPYVFPGDETFHVLEGEVTIQVEDGDSVTLRPGDIASFTKGQVSTWRIAKPFKKFFVISG